LDKSFVLVGQSPHLQLFELCSKGVENLLGSAIANADQKLLFGDFLKWLDGSFRGKSKNKMDDN